MRVGRVAPTPHRAKSQPIKQVRLADRSHGKAWLGWVETPAVLSASAAPPLLGGDLSFVVEWCLLPGCREIAQHPVGVAAKKAARPNPAGY